MRWRWRSGLATKLALCLVLSAIALSSVFGWLNLRFQQRHAERQVVTSADRLSDLIQRSARFQMMRNDREALYHLIQDVGREQGILRVRIFNREGRISYSTATEEVDTMVDKGAEQCYACHAQSAPLTRLDRPDRARIFRNGGGQRVLAMIRPIENQPACANAECHAHPASQRILGVIDTQLSLASVDAETAETQWRLFWSSGITASLLSLVSVAFIWLMVHRPIRELMKGTQKISQGDLRYRLPVRSTDELGALAESFNKMTVAVARSDAELEERVRRKTEELERATASLISSEKMASLGKLAATVAHEVNNPLFGILTYARLTLKELGKAALPEKDRNSMMENLVVIENESRRCGDIVRNLLAFARQSAPQRAPTEINTLVERALGLVRHQLELQEITLESSLAPELPEVLCDAGQIQQVLVVLLVNAIEAMPKGGVLTVATEGGLDAGLRVRVRDSGPGIQPDILPQIFEPFFTTKDTQQHGAGLGLAIAKGILERHGGAIAVESKPGDGAEFVVTLPATAAGERTELSYALQGNDSDRGR
jgi:two-component system, NtrC family, sensor kinase